MLYVNETGYAQLLILGEYHELLSVIKRVRGYCAVKQEKTHHFIENSMMKNYAKNEYYMNRIISYI